MVHRPKGKKVIRHLPYVRTKARQEDLRPTRRPPAEAAAVVGWHGMTPPQWTPTPVSREASSMFPSMFMLGMPRVLGRAAVGYV